MNSANENNDAIDNGQAINFFEAIGNGETLAQRYVRHLRKKCDEDSSITYGVIDIHESL